MQRAKKREFKSKMVKKIFPIILQLVMNARCNESSIYGN